MVRVSRLGLILTMESIGYFLLGISHVYQQTLV